MYVVYVHELLHICSEPSERQFFYARVFNVSLTCLALAVSASHCQGQSSHHVIPFTLFQPYTESLDAVIHSLLGSDVTFQLYQHPCVMLNAVDWLFFRRRGKRQLCLARLLTTGFIFTSQKLGKLQHAIYKL